MAVLPFDPSFRRRTPAGGGPAVPAPGAPAPRPTPPDGVGRLPGGDLRRVGDRPVRRPVAVEPPAPTARSLAELARGARRDPLAEAAAGRPARQAEERALARTFFPLALLVACADLASKAFVVAGVAAGETLGAGPIALRLVYNRLSAGSVSLGAHTQALNATATGVLIGILVMLVPTLARLDRRATLAVALVAGGGLGNLVSMLTTARGVPDFLAVRHGHGAWVLNVADLAIGAGLLLLVRTAWLLLRAVRTHGARTPVGAVGRLA